MEAAASASRNIDASAAADIMISASRYQSCSCSILELLQPLQPHPPANGPICARHSCCSMARGFLLQRTVYTHEQFGFPISEIRINSCSNTFALRDTATTLPGVQDGDDGSHDASTMTSEHHQSAVAAVHCCLLCCCAVAVAWGRG